MRFPALLLGFQGLGIVIIVLWTRPVSSSTEFKPPVLRYDIHSASIWRCFYDKDSKELLDKLHGNRSMEIIHHRANWVELIFSPSGENCYAELLAIGLDSCTEGSQMSQLVEVELQHNWNSLKYHVSNDTLLRYPDVTSSKFTTELASESIRGGRIVRSTDIQTGDRDTKTYSFDHYLNLSAIHDWYEKLASSYPSLVSLNHSIGKTHYQRDIYAVHITQKSGNSVREKPKIYFQCLLHSREWISGPVCMYIAERLVKDTLFVGILQKVEIVFVPVANPDGYYVTWYDYPKYRMWRKNVRPLDGTKCAGVDLNRNFDSHWEHSSDPCDELYAGAAANSELETQAITNYFKSLGPSVVGAIDIHSYYQEVLYPPAWKDQNPADIEDIKRVAKSVASAATEVGASYTASRMVDLYSATGTFADWLLDQRESADNCRSMVPLTIELRPKYVNTDLATQTAGFLLPPSEIYPTCVEMLVAFLEFVELTLETSKNCYSTNEE